MLYSTSGYTCRVAICWANTCTNIDGVPAISGSSLVSKQSTPRNDYFNLFSRLSKTRIFLIIKCSGKCNYEIWRDRKLKNVIDDECGHYRFVQVFFNRFVYLPILGSSHWLAWKQIWCAEDYCADNILIIVSVAVKLLFILMIKNNYEDFFLIVKLL